MIKLIIATIVILLVIVTIASIGVIFKREPIKGSCGGLSTLGFKKACSCKEPCDAAIERERQERTEFQHKAEHQEIDASYVNNKEGEGKYKPNNQ